MNAKDLTPAELGLIRWYKELTDQRIIETIYLWLLTGDIVLTTQHLLQAA